MENRAATDGYRCFIQSSQVQSSERWRLVCRPRVLVNSSAPEIDCGWFDGLVRRAPERRYIELRTMKRNDGPVITGHPEPAVPFVRVCRLDGFNMADTEALTLRGVLSEAADDVQLG